MEITNSAILLEETQKERFDWKKYKKNDSTGENKKERFDWVKQKIERLFPRKYVYRDLIG